MPTRNHYQKCLICSKLKISWKQKRWNYIIDTNEMNFQNILNQCSLNQMIIIHMILDISLYQLLTKTSIGQLCIRHYIPELLKKTPECITEKLDTHSFSGFSNYMKNYYIKNYSENCPIVNYSYYYHYHYYHQLLLLSLSLVSLLS